MQMLGLPNGKGHESETRNTKGGKENAKKNSRFSLIIYILHGVLTEYKNVLDNGVTNENNIKDRTKL